MNEDKLKAARKRLSALRAELSDILPTLPSDAYRHANKAYDRLGDAISELTDEISKEIIE
jgi:hypothetical protein